MIGSRFFRSKEVRLREHHSIGPKANTNTPFRSYVFESKGAAKCELETHIICALIFTLTLLVQPLMASRPENDLTLAPNYIAEAPSSPAAPGQRGAGQKLSNPVASLISLPLQFTTTRFWAKGCVKLTSTSSRSFHHAPR